MKVKTYKYLELLVLFVLIPVSFLFNYNPWLKLSIGFTGFIYVVFVLLKVEEERLRISQSLNWYLFFKTTFTRLVVIIIITTLFVWFTNKDLLFHVLLNKPKLWLFILFIYSLFSVYPQELLFRTFFFKRYGTLFKSSVVLVFVNATLFSMGHLLFKNTLVLVLTFIGGLIFAYSFNKTKSTFLVSIEHAIYGCWLFTVGMGDMLGFPS
jgi:membrane protease YdiL (CAAX protease family)